MEKEIYDTIMSNPFGLSALDVLEKAETLTYTASTRKQQRLDIANKNIYNGNSQMEILIILNRLEDINNTSLKYVDNSVINTFNQSIDKFIKENS